MVSLLLAVCLSTTALAAEREGAWDLTPIYADDDAHAAALTAMRDRLDDLDPYRGRLDKGAALREALEISFDIDKEMSRLWGYASMRGDEDIRDSGPQGMQQQMRALWSELSSATAWLEPEVLAIAPRKLAKLRAAPGMEPYQRWLDRLEARRPHVLDARSEEILGMAARLRGEGNEIAGILRNAEIPWKSITLSDGTELRVDNVGYTVGRASAERKDRLATYKAFYSKLDAFGSSLAAALSATVNEHVFEARVRGYDSSLEASLLPNEVDPAVYEMLVTEVNAGLPVLHRYLRIRADILGVGQLRYQDMYPSLVPDVDEDYTFARSKTLTMEALALLGDDYAERLGFALDNGWVDVYPSEGKRSGAYVTDAAYDVHPYMLLNHTDDYQGLTTLAHEGGHLMHSVFSSEAQPYPTKDYVTFVAEVASTVNEVLLVEHLLAEATSTDARRALLGNFLESLRTTVFRQTMFAEFERDIHAMVEAGEPLSSDVLDAHYGELLRRYHGHDEGVTRIDELMHTEWAYIPHFHYDFYVYQYATSYVAAIALSKGILEGRPGAVEAYRAFLAAGSTRPPVDLLKAAGVDMTGPQPIRDALAYMGSVMDRLEALPASP